MIAAQYRTALGMVQITSGFAEAGLVNLTERRRGSFHMAPPTLINLEDDEWRMHQENKAGKIDHSGGRFDRDRLQAEPECRTP